MSEILIQGMEMPKSGYKTVYIHSNGCIYEPTSNNLIWKTIGKAIPVPPHGDLIDRDALPGVFYNHDGEGAFLVYDADDIDDAPTIIPASEEVSK